VLARTSALVPSRYWPLGRAEKVCAALISGAMLVALLAAAYVAVRETRLLATIMNPEVLQAHVSAGARIWVRWRRSQLPGS